MANQRLFPPERGFHAIFNFIGHALDEELEYHVDSDARTLPIKKMEIQSVRLS